MVDDFLEILSINLQAIPDVRNVIKGGNELVFIMRVAVALPTYKV
jgi:hypothetical protein